MQKVLNYSSSIKSLIADPIEECLIKIAEILDEYDPMGDDWRRLWSELIGSSLSEPQVRSRKEGPTMFVLKKWSHMRPPAEATVGQLIRAFSAIYRNDVAEILEMHTKVRLLWRNPGVIECRVISCTAGSCSYSWSFTVACFQTAQ